MAQIDTGLNGAFVTSAHDASPEPQSLTVYATRTTFTDGSAEYWNVTSVHPTDERVRSVRDMLRRSGYEGRELLEIGVVSRVVTISATEWTEER